jgi:hypothetical protein
MKERDHPVLDGRKPRLVGLLPWVGVRDWVEVPWREWLAGRGVIIQHFCSLAWGRNASPKRSVSDRAGGGVDLSETHGCSPGLSAGAS